MEGQSRSVIRSYGCYQKRRGLSGETGVKQMCFQVFPEGCDRQAIYYLKGERVPKNRGIKIERIGNV